MVWWCSSLGLLYHSLKLQNPIKCDMHGKNLTSYWFIFHVYWLIFGILYTGVSGVTLLVKDSMTKLNGRQSVYKYKIHHSVIELLPRLRLIFQSPYFWNLLCHILGINYRSAYGFSSSCKRESFKNYREYDLFIKTLIPKS